MADQYGRERDRLTRTAKICIDAGIDERRIRLAEQQGQLLARVIHGILTDLGVLSMPDTPHVVRRHLQLAAGTSTDPAG